MPLITVVRALFSLLSLLILAAAVYLLWSWWDGEAVLLADGTAQRLREDWRLWTAVGLLAFSLLGRPLVLPLLARPDSGEPSRAVHGQGQVTESPTGSRLYVEQAGPSGRPTLILTHGWGLDSTVWGYAKRDLGQAYRLVLWDLPGLGRSRPAGGVRLELAGFAADLRSLVLAQGRPVVLVGHSIGGMTIQQLHDRSPELFGREVAGVVLVNTTPAMPLRTMILSGLALALRRPVLEPMFRLTKLLGPLSQLSAWQSYLNGTAHMAQRVGFGPHVTRSQLEHATLLATRNSQAFSAEGNLAMFRWNGAQALERMGCPVLVLGGDQDLVTKAEASRAIAAHAPGAELTVMDAANHMGFLDRADAYNAAIAVFAERVFAGAARAAS